MSLLSFITSISICMLMSLVLYLLHEYQPFSQISSFGCSVESHILHFQNGILNSQHPNLLSPKYPHFNFHSIPQEKYLGRNYYSFLSLPHILCPVHQASLFRFCRRYIAHQTTAFHIYSYSTKTSSFICQATAVAS